MLCNAVGITALGIFNAIGVGQVRLYVKNRRSVQQICARNKQRIAVLFGMLYFFQLYARKPDMIRAKGGAAGKHTHARITA